MERATSSFVLTSETATIPVIGRLVARGLDDELKGTAYAVVDGIDGRTHHVKLPDLDAAGARSGSIVELRQFEDSNGRHRVALAVRSDLAIDTQVKASGATWIDRQLVAREPTSLSDGGFGAEVQAAMTRVSESPDRGACATAGATGHLRPRPSRHAAPARTRNRRREARRRDRMPYHSQAEGEHIAGAYRQRVSLSSGRFAMIDDGLGFRLVPWSPSLERHLGRQVSGSVRSTAGSTGASAASGGLGPDPIR